MSIKKQYMALIALILAGEAIFFLPFVLARIFRPTLLIVFNITNTELGTYLSVYGIVALVSYFFGGPLADRFPARNLMAFALWLTANAISKNDLPEIIRLNKKTSGNIRRILIYNHYRNINHSLMLVSKHN